MKALSGFYYVDDGQTVTACRGRGKLRHQKVTPLVGDRVEFTPLGDGSGSLDRILPRKNQFYRPAVANIDQLVIIASQAIPVTDPFLIDRVVAIAQSRDCPCVICVNKCDLEPGDDLAAVGAHLGHAQSRHAPVRDGPALPRDLSVRGDQLLRGAGDGRSLRHPGRALCPE